MLGKRDPCDVTAIPPTPPATAVPSLPPHTTTNVLQQQLQPLLATATTTTAAAISSSSLGNKLPPSATLPPNKRPRAPVVVAANNSNNNSGGGVASADVRPLFAVTSSSQSFADFSAGCSGDGRWRRVSWLYCLLYLHSLTHTHTYIYIHALDIEGIPGFIFRRVHDKFHLGLFSIVYLVLSFCPAAGTNIFKGR